MKKHDFETRLYWSHKSQGPAPCWRWTHGMPRGRREKVCVHGKSVPVVREVYRRLVAAGYELAGPLRKNVALLRTCDDPHCVNPFHHAPADSASVDVKALNGRGKANREKTHCPYGHEYTEDNLVDTNDGRRHCKICHRLRNKWYWARRLLVPPAPKKLSAEERAELETYRNLVGEIGRIELHDPPEEPEVMCDAEDVWDHSILSM